MMKTASPKNRWLMALVLAASGIALTFAPAAGQEAAVAYAARDLPRGVTLTAEDIRYAPPEVGTGTVPADVGPGWVTRRVIAQGEALRAPAVTPPTLVSRGDPVDVVVQRGTIVLRLRGTALGSAREGEAVNVRIDSRRRLEGIAAGPGLVQINGELR